MPSKPKNMTARAACRRYLERAGDLPAARRLAKRHGFSANTSIWIEAMGDMLRASMTRAAKG